MDRGTLRAIAAAICLTLPAAIPAQEDEEAERLAQILVDMDALVIGTEVSMRCALYDDTLDYLTPLESAGATFRLQEMEALLAPEIPDLDARMVQMLIEAHEVPCGHPGLVPFLEYNRDIAREIVSTALLAWRDISLERCNFFADEDFMAAVDRAEARAEDFEPPANAPRAAMIAENAARWVAIFESNCPNLGFDPTTTLPGHIALALPMG